MGLGQSPWEPHTFKREGPQSPSFFSGDGRGDTDVAPTLHSFMSLVAVHAPTEVFETEEKEMFYTKLDSALNKSPCMAILVVLGEFNAFTDTDWAGYDMCIGPHRSYNRNNNSSLLLNLRRSRRLRITSSWYQRSDLRWLI